MLEPSITPTSWLQHILNIVAIQVFNGAVMKAAAALLLLACAVAGTFLITRAVMLQHSGS